MTTHSKYYTKKNFKHYTKSDFQELVLDKQLFQDNYENNISFRNCVNDSLGITHIDWAYNFFLDISGKVKYEYDSEDMHYIIKNVARSCLNDKANAEYYARDLDEYVIIETRTNNWSCYDGMSDALNHIWQRACHDKIYDDMYYMYRDDHNITKDWIFPDGV